MPRSSILVLALALFLIVGSPLASAATIRGTGGADTIRGTSGKDVIYGLGGNDTIRGFGGNDTIYAGAGRDKVYCGAGVDRVVIDSADVVSHDCEVVSRVAKPHPVTASPSPTKTTTTTTTTTPAASLLGSRAKPYPLGTAVKVDSGRWTITVLGTTPDATTAVLAENRFNDPPAAGNQFFIVRVQATYNGPDNRLFLGSDLKLVGSANRVYSTYGSTSRCGVEPDDISDKGSVFAGASVTGNICFQVPSSEVASLSMFSDELLSTDVFFALQ